MVQLHRSPVLGAGAGTGWLLGSSQVPGYRVLSDTVGQQGRSSP